MQRQRIGEMRIAHILFGNYEWYVFGGHSHATTLLFSILIKRIRL